MTHPVWETPTGSIGTYPSLVPMIFQLRAEAELPAVNVFYSLLSGNLPNGLVLNENGLISGTPTIESKDTTFIFVIRATDNYQEIRDRTFTITISGAAIPQFTTPSGSLITTLDSVWLEIPINYSNPISTNPVTIRLLQGSLPPGMEINKSGLIRGYPEAPTNTINLSAVITSATNTDSTNNRITCLTTSGFSIGRPIIFGGTTFGDIVSGTTYYIKQIINETQFTISATQNGDTFLLTTDLGFMSINLPTIAVGQPVIRTYSFSLTLESPLGNDIESYLITVINQNLPVSQGGPGNLNRTPTIYNTRPPTYDIATDTENFGYYVLPPDSQGYTYLPSQDAYIGQIFSGDYFAFKIIGHDFDSDTLKYEFSPSTLPLGLVGDEDTGWITGYPAIAENSIADYGFKVRTYKASFPDLSTTFFNFTFRVTNGLDGLVRWLTDSDLGTIFNGTISNKSVEALAEVPLSYRITSGNLPPNLTLLDNGEITGVVAFQPTNAFLNPGTETTFTFTIEAFSTLYSGVIALSKTFTIKVIQEFNQPTDTLYIKCTPSFTDRLYISSLLTDTTLIPDDYLYRPNDIYFGKATNVIYEHAYGIFSSDIDEYIDSVTKNHYWRNITLGEISTAVARNEKGEIIYEVVYSNVIDNLINPSGKSVSKEIFWPRLIDLNLGPWYTSITNIYTSYEYNDITYLQVQLFQPISTQNLQWILSQQGLPSFYTSLTPGYARLLYPNSLPNMRQQVADVLGQEFDFRLLPAWMTSQQLNGSTLGYTPAWVICFCKPRIIVDGEELTYEQFEETGLDRNDYKSYAEQIAYNINNDWKDELGNNKRLNQINFQIDRFTVDKSITYNYDKNVSPPAWTGLPSASPVPDPLDSKDFYVLVPRKTILPNIPQNY